MASILVGVGGKSVAAAGAVPRCHTGDLGASLGRSGVGPGNVTTEVALQNPSDHVCFVYGYPGFGLQDRHQRVQPSPGSRGAARISRATPDRIAHGHFFATALSRKARP
jgi:hypothetical protein